MVEPIWIQEDAPGDDWVSALRRLLHRRREYPRRWDIDLGTYLDDCRFWGLDNFEALGYARRMTARLHRDGRVRREHRGCRLVSSPWRAGARLTGRQPG